MNKATRLSFIVITAMFIAFMVPNYTYASNGNNFNQQAHNFYGRVQDFFKHKDKDKNKDKDKRNNSCKDHPEKRECHVSVPEFGSIQGVIAALTSGGAFLFLKKRV